MMTTWTKRDTALSVLLACIAGFIFVPLALSSRLFLGNELRNAEIAREMLILGDFFHMHTDFQPLWNLPPLYFWLQSASMHVFTVNDAAARLPNIALSILLAPLLYLLGKQIKSGFLGILWVMCFFTLPVTLFLFGAGSEEPMFATLLFLSGTFLSRYYAPTGGKVFAMRRIIIAAFFLGLGILIKGFVAMALILAIWFLFLLFERFFLKGQSEFPITEMAVCTAMTLLMTLLWIGNGLWEQGIPFFREFITQQFNQVMALGSEESVFFTLSTPYYFLLLPIIFFPSLGLINFPLLLSKSTEEPSIDGPSRKPLHTFGVWMLGFAAVAFFIALFFQDLLLSASMLAFPLSFFAARTLEKLITENRGNPNPVTQSKILFGFAPAFPVVTFGISSTISLATALFLALIPTFFIDAQPFFATMNDKFAQAALTGALNTDASWSYWYCGFGIILFVTSAVSLTFFLKRKYFEFAFTLLPVSILILTAFFHALLPKSETLSQGAAVEFYQSLRNDDCYLETLGFSSSAANWYAQKKVNRNAVARNIPPEEFQDWLLEGEIDATAYFVCKIHEASKWRSHRYLSYLYSKNGYSFFKRDPKARPNFASGALR